MATAGASAQIATGNLVTAVAISRVNRSSLTWRWAGDHRPFPSPKISDRRLFVSAGINGNYIHSLGPGKKGAFVVEMGFHGDPELMPG